MVTTLSSKPKKIVIIAGPNGADKTTSARIAARVEQVPVATIRRRFDGGLSNFYQRYKALVDVWLHFDNAGDQPQLLDWSES